MNIHGPFPSLHPTGPLVSRPQPMQPQPAPAKKQAASSPQPMNTALSALAQEPDFDLSSVADPARQGALDYLKQQQLEIKEQIGDLDAKDLDYARSLKRLDYRLDVLQRKQDAIEKAPDVESMEAILNLDPTRADFEQQFLKVTQGGGSEVKSNAIDRLSKRQNELLRQLQQLDPKSTDFHEKAAKLSGAVDGLKQLREKIEAASDDTTVQSLAKQIESEPEKAAFKKDVSAEIAKNQQVPLTAQQQAEYSRLWGGYANDERFPNFPNDANRAYFKMLSPEDRQTFCDLRAMVKGDKDAYDCLEGLLEDLSASSQPVDSQGRNILGVMKDFMGQELSPELQKLGVSKQEMLTQLVKELRGTTVTQGKGTDTCSCAAMQNLLATKQPAEYLRMVTDLLVKGETNVKEFMSMKLSTKALSATDERPALDDLVQGSFMDFARQFSPETTSTYSGRGRSGGTYRGSTQLPGGGLTANQIQNLYRYTTGDPPAVVRVTPENREKVMQAMREAGLAGYDITAGIHLDGDPTKGHAINLTGMLQPQDYSGGQRLTPVSVEDSEGPYTATYLEEVIKDVDMVIIPSDYTKGLSKDDCLEYDWSGSGRGSSGGTRR